MSMGFAVHASIACSKSPAARLSAELASGAYAVADPHEPPLIKQLSMAHGTITPIEHLRK